MLRRALKVFNRGRGGGAPIQCELPVLRLPSTVFPGQPVSLPVLEDYPEERPIAGAVTPELAREVAASSGRLALLADGAQDGVIVDLPRLASRAHVGALLHVVGKQRVSLLETRHKTPAGGRLARLVALNDDAISAGTARAVEDEAAVARALLRSGPAAARDLTLCTLLPEANILPWGADPATHPLWHDCARLPGSGAASGLGWWLAARLPLTLGLRLHVLGSKCPLKRMRELNTAMRLLAQPSRRSRQARGPDGVQMRALRQLEAPDGRRIEPPRVVIDLAMHRRTDAAASRWEEDQ